MTTDTKELFIKALSLKKANDFKGTVQICKILWADNREGFDAYSGGAYAYSLYKLGQYEACLDVCRYLFKLNPDNTYITNLYAWTIYHLEVKSPKKEREHSPRFFKAVDGILRITKQEEYSPFTITALKAIDYCKELSNWEKLLEYANRLDGESLLSQRQEIIDAKGRPRKLISQRQSYYNNKTKALYELKKYKECLELCEAILCWTGDTDGDFFFWISERKAKAQTGLGSYHEALVTLESLVAKKKDWYNFFHLAKLHNKLGNQEESLRCAAEAALLPGEHDKKVSLYELLAKLLLLLGKKEEALLHIQQAYRLRELKSYKIPSSLIELTALLKEELQLVPGEDKISDNRQDYTLETTQLESIWEEARYGGQEPRRGVIANILDNGKGGFIKGVGNDNQSYFFSMSSFKDKRELAVKNTYVTFYLIPSYDKKKDRVTQAAVNIRLIN